MTWHDQLAERLVLHAAARLRPQHPDWAAAMLGELQAVPPQERLRWAAGCVGASLGAPGAGAALAYPTALLAALGAMTLFQWSADEGVHTVMVIAGLSLLLGLLRPERALVSGVAVGLVVAFVLTFETLSGLRPAYETHIYTLLQDLRWVVLVIPALAAAAAGHCAAKFVARVR